MMPSRSSFLSRARFLAALASEAVAPVLRGAARVATGRATPPASWRRGLILGHDHIGDVLYRTPTLPHLSRLFPDCEWHYVTSPVGAELLFGNPHLAGVITRSADKSPSSRRADWRALAARRFDVALCTNSIAYHNDLALAVRLAVPNRVCFTHKGASGLVTHQISGPPRAPWPAHFRALVAQLAGVRPDWDLRPQIFPDADDEASASRLWHTLQLGARPVVACTMTTRQPVRVWSASRFLTTLEKVHQSDGVDVVMCGDATEAPVLQRVAATASFPCHVVAGELRLRAFGCFLRRCAALLAWDSGPRHIANAVGTPVVFIRGISGPRVEQGAYCATEIDIAPPDADCVPWKEQATALAAIEPEAAAVALRRALLRMPAIALS